MPVYVEWVALCICALFAIEKNWLKHQLSRVDVTMNVLSSSNQFQIKRNQTQHFVISFFSTFDSIDLAWTVERQPWIIYEEWIQLDWIALRFLVTFLPPLFFVLCQLRQFEWRFNDFFDNDDYFFLFFLSSFSTHFNTVNTEFFFLRDGLFFL